MKRGGYGINALRLISGTSDNSQSGKDYHQQQYRNDIADQIVPDFKTVMSRECEFFMTDFAWNCPGY
jgi:hypothetical protein